MSNFVDVWHKGVILGKYPAKAGATSIEIVYTVERSKGRILTKVVWMPIRRIQRSRSGKQMAFAGALYGERLEKVKEILAKYD